MDILHTTSVKLYNSKAVLSYTTRMADGETALACQLQMFQYANIPMCAYVNKQLRTSWRQGVWNGL